MSSSNRPPGKVCPSCGAMASVTAASCLRCGEVFGMSRARPRTKLTGDALRREMVRRRTTLMIVGAIVLVPLLLWLFICWPIRHDLYAAQSAVRAAGCPDVEFKVPLFLLHTPEQVEIGGGF